MQDKAQPPQAPENGNRAPETEFNSRVRAQLSIIVVAGFVATLLLAMVLQFFNTRGSELLPTVDSIAAVYAGVTGAVVGYWFGKG